MKKVPLKADTDNDHKNKPEEIYADDNMWEDMDTSGGSEKFVKFASTAEVREFGSRRHSSPTKKVFNARQDMIKEKPVKARLGLSKTKKYLLLTICFKIICFADTKSHTVKKRINNFKSPSPTKKVLTKMKADLTRELPVHKRLGATNSKSASPISSVSSISKRLGKVTVTGAGAASTTRGSKSSVFDRLGFNS